MTENELIEAAFAELKRLRLVRHRCEFVTQWLGREESYLRVLRHKRRNASADVICNCAQRITMYAGRLAQSPHRALRKLADELCVLKHRLDSNRR